jgi:hypothetical protein
MQSSKHRRKEESMQKIWPRLALMSGLCLTVGAAFLLVASSPDKAEKAPPDLSGTWTITEDLTQTPQQGMRENRPQGAWGGRQDGGGGRGGRGGGGMGRRGGGGEEGGASPATPSGEGGSFGGIEEGAGDVMTINWIAPQLTVSYPGDRKRVFFTDGRKVKEDRPGGKTVKTRARWTDAGSLEVVTNLDNGITRTEIFELSNDGKRLFIIVGIEGRGPEPLKFHRVYDKLDPRDKEEEDEDADQELA